MDNLEILKNLKKALISHFSNEVDALFNDMKTFINKMQEIIKLLNSGLNKS
jgi:hypothetical protein